MHTITSHLKKQISPSLFSHLYQSVYRSPTHTLTQNIWFLFCLASFTTWPRFSSLSLSVSGRGGISCLEQEQKVAQDECCFLRWHAQHVPTGPDHSALQSEEVFQGACWVAPNVQLMFSANSSHICMPEIKDSCTALTSGELRAVHLQFIWSLLSQWVVLKVFVLAGRYVMEWL